MAARTPRPLPRPLWKPHQPSEPPPSEQTSRTSLDFDPHSREVPSRPPTRGRQLRQHIHKRPKQHGTTRARLGAFTLVAVHSNRRAVPQVHRIDRDDPRNITSQTKSPRPPNPEPHCSSPKKNTSPLSVKLQSSQRQVFVSSTDSSAQTDKPAWQGDGQRTSIKNRLFCARASGGSDAPLARDEAAISVHTSTRSLDGRGGDLRG